jgi:FkbM family methyltransferase
MSIVQIGAYKGESFNDPLCDFLKSHLDAESVKRDAQIKVVLIEPVREFFEQLCESYADLFGVEFENVAIAETAGERDFYRLSVDPRAHGYPAWLSQLGSLRSDSRFWDELATGRRWKEFFLTHRTVERVECITLAMVLEKHRIRELDLLQIDAEGYDYEILKTLDFARLRPRFINYEHALLRDDEKAKCRDRLERENYVLMEYGYDTFCIRMDA